MGSEAEILAAKWGIPITVALLAVGVRLLFSANRVTVFGVVRGILVGVFVGGLTANYLFDVPATVLSNGSKGVIIAVIAILSEDIVVGILRLGKKFRKDPESVIRFFKGDQK